MCAATLQGGANRLLNAAAHAKARAPRSHTHTERFGELKHNAVDMQGGRARPARHNQPCCQSLNQAPGRKLCASSKWACSMQRQGAASASLVRHELHQALDNDQVGSALRPSQVRLRVVLAACQSTFDLHCVDHPACPNHIWSCKTRPCDDDHMFAMTCRRCCTSCQLYVRATLAALDLQHRSAAHIARVIRSGRRHQPRPASARRLAKARMAQGATCAAAFQEGKAVQVLRRAGGCTGGGSILHLHHQTISMACRTRHRA
jgi:hypothetical protein